ncbi:MAG: response regulator transcription factor [Desulfobacterales bacterium]|nr:response regulator transcription factor [Desulfobacterales bacterium]
MKKDAPVLMLTARDALSDKLEGFDAGADDYLVKPFAMEELEARLHALIKRGDRTKPRRMRVGELELNLGSMTVRRDGKTIRLNKACMKILELLIKASPDLVSRSDLEFALWGDEPPGTDALRSHMYTLRRKIDKPFSHPMLQTVHGMGYRLRRPDGVSS